MSVPLGFFVIAWTYSYAVNFVPAYRGPIDSFGHAAIGLENTVTKDEETANGVEGNDKGGVTHSDSDTPEIVQIKN